MSKIENEIWLEEAMVSLEEACEKKDWATARAICADVEEKGFDSFAFRRVMNTAMSKPNPFTVEGAWEIIQQANREHYGV